MRACAGLWARAAAGVGTRFGASGGVIVPRPPSRSSLGAWGRPGGGGGGGGGGAAAAAPAMSLSSSLLRASSVGTGILVSGGIFLAANTLGFAVTAQTRTHKVFDLLSSGAFAVSAVATHLAGPQTRAGLLLTTTTCLWSIRLTSYLFKRVLDHGTDTRLAKYIPEGDQPWTSSNLASLGALWGVAATWGFVVSLPVTLLNSVAATTTGPVFYLAMAGQVGGFLVEAIADYQKSAFKADKANRDRFIQTGLWRYSRHPNYFGEMLGWWSATGATLVSTGASPPVTLLAILSPALTTFLLLKVSGVNLAEEASDRKYGQRQDYLLYKRTTSEVLPWFPTQEKHS